MKLKFIFLGKKTSGLFNEIILDYYKRLNNHPCHHE